MRTGWDEAREAVRDGLALAPAAARAAWLSLGVSALGWAALFVAGRADLPAEAAASLGWTGAALVALMAAPKLGALHRLAAGDATADPLGRGGLQWGRTEGRLLADALALGALGGLMLAAFAVAAFVALSALRPLGQVQAGPLGPLGVGFLGLCPLLLLALAAMADAVGRFLVTLPADAVETEARFSRGWRLTRGAGAAPAVVLVLTTLAPWAALLTLGSGLDALEGARRWSWPEAALAGGVLAALGQFVFAPINAGALRRLYLDGLAREGSAAPARGVRTAVDTGQALGDKAHPAGAAPVLPAAPEFSAP